MTLSYKQKDYIAFIGIFAIIGVCIYLILINVFVSWSILIAFGCCALWITYIRDKRTIIERICKSLHKSDFHIDDMYWDKERCNLLNIIGKYSDEHFLINATPDCEYIKIYYLPWSGIKVSDPKMNNVLEAVNESNIHLGNCSIILTEADEEGIREILTQSTTILPEDNPVPYLESLMCAMINSKHTFAESMQKQHSQAPQERHHIVGFSANAQTI